MWSCVIGVSFRVPNFLNKVVLRAQKCHWHNGKCDRYCITVSFPLFLIIYPMINKALSRVSSTRMCLFYLTVFYLCSNPSIPNFYNLDQICILVSQKICDHIFQIQSWIISSFFVKYLACIFFPGMWKMST